VVLATAPKVNPLPLYKDFPDLTQSLAVKNQLRGKICQAENSASTFSMKITAGSENLNLSLVS
jgi:hypothetical protein